MAQSEHVLVNPVTQPIIAPFDGAPRLASLAGTRLGIIDDSKRNADVLLEELAGEHVAVEVALIQLPLDAVRGLDRGEHQERGRHAPPSKEP